MCLSERGLFHAAKQSPASTLFPRSSFIGVNTQKTCSYKQLHRHRALLCHCHLVLYMPRDLVAKSHTDLASILFSTLLKAKNWEPRGYRRIVTSEPLTSPVLGGTYRAVAGRKGPAGSPSVRGAPRVARRSGKTVGSSTYAFLFCWDSIFGYSAFVYCRGLWKHFHQNLGTVSLVFKYVSNTCHMYNLFGKVSPHCKTSQPNHSYCLLR